MSNGEENRSSMFKQLLALPVLLALASGCASAREGYLYDSKAPRQGFVLFEDAQATRGRILAVLADGEHCAGTFNTVPDRVHLDKETALVDGEESQVGLAILQCNAQHVVRCGFQRDQGGAGYGHCSDTGGRHFDLYF